MAAGGGDILQQCGGAVGRLESCRCLHGALEAVTAVMVWAVGLHRPVAFKEVGRARVRQHVAGAASRLQLGGVLGSARGAVLDGLIVGAGGVYSGRTLEVGALARCRSPTRCGDGRAVGEAALQRLLGRRERLVPVGEDSHAGGR